MFLLGGLSFVGSSIFGIAWWNLWISGSLCDLGLGFVMPTAFSQAMEPFHDRAGKASALLSVSRLGMSGVVVSVSSFFYDESAMGVVICLGGLALAQAIVVLKVFVINGKASD